MLLDLASHPTQIVDMQSRGDLMGPKLLWELEQISLDALTIIGDIMASYSRSDELFVKELGLY